MSSLLRGDGDQELRELRNGSSSRPRRHRHPQHWFRVGRARLPAKTTTLAVFPNEANMPSLLPISSQNQSGKEFKSSPPCQAIFKYIIPSLIALLPGKTKNPFETHPANMWTFFIAACIYCLALGFMKEMKINSATYSGILGYDVSIISGAISLVSLVSIFLPDLLGLLVVLAFLYIILTSLLFKLLYNCCIRQRIAKAIDWVRDKFNSARREQPSLPV